MSDTRKEKSPFGKTPSAMLKDIYFLVDAADHTKGPVGHGVKMVYDPIRRSMVPARAKANIYSEWAKLQKWLNGRRHFVNGRATGKVRPKCSMSQMSLAL